MRPGLHAIADADACRAAGAELAAVAMLLLEAGPAALQLRWKGAPAAEFLALTRAVVARARALSLRVPVIVNDRVDIALLGGADGVHLGQEDLPLARAREQLPEGSLLGLSTHEGAQVAAAVRAGADYLGFGPVFPTASKRLPEAVVGLEGLEAAVRGAGAVPVIAIGGVRDDRAPAVHEAGAKGAAVIGAFFSEGASLEAVGRRARALVACFASTPE